MTAADPAITVVGGGVAGFAAVKQLRGKGHEGRIHLVDTQGEPYDRPMLSKAYLSGRLEATTLRFCPEQWYADQAVELVTDTVASLDPDAGGVRLASGGTVTGDAIVLATGGIPRRLACPGGGDPGLHYLRSRADSDALRERLVPGHRLAIVGAGLIGAEVAATAAGLGVEVTLIDPVLVPAAALLGDELAAYLHEQHLRHGVTLHQAGVRQLSRNGAQWQLDLSDRSENPDTVGAGTVTADTVLVAIGITPDTGLAETAGLAVDDGILVDELQRSSHPRVYAAGDAARLRLPDGTLPRRHEHWESAMRTGQNVAAGVLGLEPAAPTAPWMWSDRYGLHVESCGDMSRGTLVDRPGADGNPMAAFRLSAAGHILGAAAINGGTTIRAARRLIDRRIACDPESLADPGVDLKKLAR